jgi:cobyrinic acid a,c-diamide synthase
MGLRYINTEYERFAQHYLEMFDTWVEHQLKVDELKELNELEESNEPIPTELMNELIRHRFIVSILEDTAIKVYGKNHDQIFSDAVALYPTSPKGEN